MRNDLTSRETQGLLATLVAAPVAFVVVYTLVSAIIGGDFGLLLGVILATLAFASVPLPMARFFSAQVPARAPQARPAR